MCSGIGWMAERSKALVSGTSLFGGEGSNPSSVTTFLPRGKFANLTQFSKLAPLFMSRLAQLVERKTLNLVVVGSSPTVGIPFWSLWHTFILLVFFFLGFIFGSWEDVPGTGGVFAPVAQLAARRSHNPKVASSILAGSSNFFSPRKEPQTFRRFCVRPASGCIGWMAERSKALV